MGTKASRALRTAIAFGAVAVFACTSSTGGDATPPSADASRPAGNWLDIPNHRILDAATDPDSAHRAVGCALGTPRVEDETLEFTTNDCVLFWVGVPLRSSVNAGEPLRLVTTHSALVARAPAEAHLRIDLEDEVLVNRTVPIPSSDAIDIATVTPTRDHAAGALLRVHLHNHGENGWRVVSLGRAP